MSYYSGNYASYYSGNYYSGGGYGYVNVTPENSYFSSGGYSGGDLSYVTVTGENDAFTAGGAYYSKGSGYGANGQVGYGNGQSNYGPYTPQSKTGGGSGSGSGGGGGMTGGGSGSGSGSGQQQKQQQAQPGVTRIVYRQRPQTQNLSPLVTGSGINNSVAPGNTNQAGYTNYTNPGSYAGTNWAPYLLIGGAALAAYMAFGKSK